MGAQPTTTAGRRPGPARRALRWAAATGALVVAAVVSAFDPTALLVAAAVLALVGVVVLLSRSRFRVIALVTAGTLAGLGFLAWLVFGDALRFAAPPGPRLVVPILHEVEAAYQPPDWSIVETVSVTAAESQDLVSVGFPELDPPATDVVEETVEDALVAAGWEPAVRADDQVIFRRERLEPVRLRRLALRTTHALDMALPRARLEDHPEGPWMLVLLPEEGSELAVTAPQRLVLTTTPPAGSRVELSGGLEEVRVPLAMTVTDWVRSPDTRGAVRVDTARGVLRFTPVGPLLARMEAVGWWLLPATVAIGLAVAIWQAIRNELVRVLVARLRRILRLPEPAT